MLTIQLRRYDGKMLPYELEIQTAGLDEYLEFRVKASDTGEVLSSETFHQDQIPMTRYHADVEGATLIMGCDPDGDRMIFEYGNDDDRRLALAGMGEFRSAVNVCRWHDRDLIAA